MTNDTRASGRSTRRKLSSPGRPRAALRSGQVTFWQRIKQGVSSEEACMQAGASAPVGSRWFRQAGGLPPSKFANASASLSGRYLSFLNVKRSRCTERKALASVRSPGRPGALRPAFLGNATGMLQHARAALSIAQPRLNGLRIVRHVGPKRQNYHKTMPCARMLKIGFRVRYRTRMGPSSQHLMLRGQRDGLCADNIVDAPQPGAQNKAPAACHWTFRMTPGCASVTKQYIRPCSFRDV